MRRRVLHFYMTALNILEYIYNVFTILFKSYLKNSFVKSIFPSGKISDYNFTINSYAREMVVS